MRDWRPALLVVALTACGVNPVPEPPAKPETTGPISANGCLECDGPITLAGQTKNADVVWAVNLDRQEPPSVADVAADGTFTLVLAGLAGEEVRVQARRDDARSDPADFVIPTEGDLVPVVRPLFDCLPAPLELDLGALALGAAPSTATVDLGNGCADPVTIDSIALRVPSPTLSSQSGATPLTLANGQSESIQLEFAPVVPGLSEEILLVEITAPVADRRAVTIFGRAAP